MKHYQDRETKRIDHVCVKRTCDLCGLTAHSEDEWYPNRYNVGETTVSCRVGVADYDGGGEGTEIVIDLCPNCFRNEFVAWLKSQDVEVVERKWIC